MKVEQAETVQGRKEIKQENKKFHKVEGQYQN